MPDRKEIAAQQVLDALKQDKITAGQARKLIVEEIGWQPGPAHKRILAATRVSILQNLNVRKPMGVAVPKKSRVA